MRNRSKRSIMKLGDVLASIVSQLSSYYKDASQAYTNAWHILEFITQKSRTELITATTLTLTQEQQKKLDNLLQEHCGKHKPLAYCLGSIPFLNLDLEIREPILIPRPETEYWCALLIQELKQQKLYPDRILDMCTGSGCIALAVASAFPDSQVDAVDKSLYALELAKENSRRNNIKNINFIQSDLFKGLDPNEPYDIIVANPPYITQAAWYSLELSVKQWEDYDALVADNNGMALVEALCVQAPRFLKKNCLLSFTGFPQLWIEIGYDQGEKSLDFCKKSGYSKSELLKDLQNNNRVVKVCLF